MTTEIITKFELLVDDSTELSASEELDLAQDIYDDICNWHDWEFLKKEWSFTTDGTATVTLPTDFSHLLEDYNRTENNYSEQSNTAGKYVIVDNTPYLVINWSDRRTYSGTSPVCYVDLANNNLVFKTAPASGLSASADYIHIPDDLTLTSSPAPFGKFQRAVSKCIFYGMASSDYIIQQINKGDSYSQEYSAKYEKVLNDMKLLNARMLNN